MAERVQSIERAMTVLTAFSADAGAGLLLLENA